MELSEESKTSLGELMNNCDNSYKLASLKNLMKLINLDELFWKTQNF